MGYTAPARGSCVCIAALLIAIVASACGGGPQRPPTLGLTPSPTKAVTQPSPTATATSLVTPLPPGEIKLPAGLTFEGALPSGPAFQLIDGRITVYRMYSAVQQFIEEARADPQRDRWDIYRPLVVEPMQPFFAHLTITHQGWQQRWAEWVRSVDLQALEHTATEMEAAGADRIAAAALTDIAGTIAIPGERHVFLLPGQFPYNPSSFYGHVTAGGAVTIFLFPAPAEEPAQFWRQNLPGLLAHELHHSVRQFLGQFPLNVIMQALSEGMADAFAEEMYGARPTAVSLDLATERRLWAEMQENAFSGDREVMSRYLMGAEDVPWGVSYFIGYKIVKAYEASHPGTSAASLVGTSALEIFQESGYKP